MPFDVAAVQAALAAENLDGWLLYDFRGSNPIALRLAGLNGKQKLATRRWFYLIPRVGAPKGLVHAIERHNLDALPGEKIVYADRHTLASGLDALLAGRHRVAMEYSPGGAIPYVSRVDAGTIDAVRQRGVEVASSGDLVQRFEALWDEAALATHRQASERLHRIKDRAFHEIATRVSAGEDPSEHAIQQLMVQWFADEGLVSEAAPVVATGASAGNPHYQPTRDTSRPIGRDAIVLLDLWGKLPTPRAVYADITWMGYTGRDIPEPASRAFAAVAEARDAAIQLVQTAAREGRDLRGWQVDQAARARLEAAGYAAHVLHRTGHSLGEDVHGNGVHLDDYETHDDRRILPGTGFTVEPGLYFEDFGVRSEVNVYFGAGEALVTGPAQAEIVRLVPRSG